jgi:hypothetical protein
VIATGGGSPDHNSTSGDQAARLWTARVSGPDSTDAPPTAEHFGRLLPRNRFDFPEPEQESVIATGGGSPDHNSTSGDQAARLWTARAGGPDSTDAPPTAEHVERMLPRNRLISDPERSDAT